MAEGDDRDPLMIDGVRELLRMMNESDIAEVLIERGDAKVHIKRAIAQPQLLNVVTASTPQVAVPAPVFLPQATPTVASSLSAEPTQIAPSGITVTAPMVGTFYGAPSPKEPAYVQAGDEVQPGDVLGIIEAMKIMNEIECEIAGRVKQVLVDSGQPVEYGQPLMVIEPI